MNELKIDNKLLKSEICEVELKNLIWGQYQRRQDEDIKDLLQNINSQGIISALVGTMSYDGKINVIDGHRRINCIMILSDPLKAAKYGIMKLNKIYNSESIVKVIVYSIDGNPLNDVQCQKVALLINTQRENWNGIDCVNHMNLRIIQYLKYLKKAEIEQFPNVKILIDNISKEKYPEDIFNKILEKRLLEHKQVVKIKEQIITEISEITGYKKTDVINYAKLSKVPEQYQGLFLKKQNRFGIYISSTENALEFFFENKEVLSEDQIEKKIKRFQAKVNPFMEKSLKIDRKDILETKKKLVKNQLIIRAVLLKKLLLQKSGNIKINLEQLIEIIENMEDITDIDDYRKKIIDITGISIPEVKELNI